MVGTYRLQVPHRLRRLSSSTSASETLTDESFPPSPGPASSIQDDILLEIVQYISSLGVILDISLTSRHTHSLLLPVLYSSVVLASTNQCLTTLALLYRRPDIARCMKKLVVRPNHRGWDALAHETELDESSVADLIISIASTGQLQALHTFMWDGMEIPSDQLWLALRVSCPKLGNVGCSIGQKPLEPESHLFEFSDLVSFSMTSHRCNFRSHRRFHQTARGEIPLPDSFWEMILVRCSNLRELTLNGYEDHLWKIDRVTSGRWHELHSLSLGYHPGGLNNYRPFREFLTVHAALKNLSITGAKYYPWDVFSDQSIGPPPSIDAFTGFWPIHRDTIPYPSFQLLERLEVYHFVWIPASWMTTIFPTLKLLPSLTSFSMGVEFRSSVGVSDTDFFRSLFSSCPNLGHVEILTSSHIDMKTFTTAICNAPKLISFSLTKVAKLTDEDMTKSAIRLARKRTGLRNFTIRHVCPWRRPEESLLKKRGTYEVLSSMNGIPVALVVCEAAYRRGQRYTRRSRLQLSFAKAENGDLYDSID